MVRFGSGDSGGGEGIQSPRDLPVCARFLATHETRELVLESDLRI
jgi:hypothetical protein